MLSGLGDGADQLDFPCDTNQYEQSNESSVDESEEEDDEDDDDDEEGEEDEDTENEEDNENEKEEDEESEVGAEPEACIGITQESKQQTGVSELEECDESSDDQMKSNVDTPLKIQPEPSNLLHETWDDVHESHSLVHNNVSAVFTEERGDFEPVKTEYMSDIAEKKVQKILLYGGHEPQIVDDCVISAIRVKSTISDEEETSLHMDLNLNTTASLPQIRPEETTSHYSEIENNSDGGNDWGLQENKDQVETINAGFSQLKSNTKLIEELNITLSSYGTVVEQLNETNKGGTDANQEALIDLIMGNDEELRHYECSRRSDSDKKREELVKGETSDVETVNIKEVHIGHSVQVNCLKSQPLASVAQLSPNTIIHLNVSATRTENWKMEGPRNDDLPVSMIVGNEEPVNTTIDVRNKNALSKSTLSLENTGTTVLSSFQSCFTDSFATSPEDNSMFETEAPLLSSICLHATRCSQRGETAILEFNPDPCRSNPSTFGGYNRIVKECVNEMSHHEEIPQTLIDDLTSHSDKVIEQVLDDPVLHNNIENQELFQVNLEA